ncbi:MAG TPA: AgmX/PglI C-terminal domain-containing protein, partial [Polyangiaceae bacterium]|nr:AgmX/PglI C-terminal domain-containing protein [Polyangiaceae bacterium]
MNGSPTAALPLPLLARLALAAVLCAAGSCARPARAPASSGAETRAHAKRGPALASSDNEALTTPDAGSAQAPGADAASDDAARESEPTTPLELVTEPPYKLYERLLPAGEVYAAGLEEELARWNLGGNSDPAHPANRAGFHPGTRVIVDWIAPPRRLPERTPRDRRTGKPRKVLSQDGVLAQARKYGYWPFRICFEEAASADRELKGGATHVRVRVSPNGRVSGARVLESELTDPDVPSCIARRFERLSFVPAPPRALDAVFEVEVYPGDAPLPRRQHPTTAPPAARENPGQLARAAITSTLESEQPALARCFADAVERDPELWGRLELRIELAESGSCARVSEHDSRFPDR